MHAYIKSGAGNALGLATLAGFDAIMVLALWCLVCPHCAVNGGVLAVFAELGVLGFVVWMSRSSKPARARLPVKTDDSSALANLAHELRSPLTVLAGEIEAAQIGLRQADARMLDALAGEVERLSRMLQDLDHLLGHSAVPDQTPVEAIDVGDLIERLLRRHDLALQRSGLAVQLQRRAVALVQGDRLRLEQLFTNLLQNSLRYTDAPGRIAISVALTVDGVVEVIWEDSAPGVPGAALPRLTERFYRVPGHGVRHPHASGLGLAIARAIAESHCVTMHARNSELGGLCWTLRIEAAYEDDL